MSMVNLCTCLVPALEMNETSFPAEIYATIIEVFVYTHVELIPRQPGEINLKPQWYLVPLIRVSRQWYWIGVKHLYQSIAVGSSGQVRGRNIAEALHKTLEANSELAALVRSLWLGIELCDCTDYLQEVVTNKYRYSAALSECGACRATWVRALRVRCSP